MLVCLARKIQRKLQINYGIFIGLQVLAIDPVRDDVNFALKFTFPFVFRYQWNFGDHSTIQNTTNQSITYSYSTAGVHCVLLTAKNAISEKLATFKISVLSLVGGLSFVSKITPAQTGASTRIGVEVRNGSDFNVSVNYGDGSPPVVISRVDDVLNSFVISLRHNYSSPGQYNVSVKAWNALNTETISSIAVVQDPVWNLTFQVSKTSIR